VVVATLAIIAAGVLAPGGPMARLLAVRPLVAIGKRSYGLYLWHFPVFVVLDTEFDGLSAGPVVGGLVLSLGLAALSYRFVEQPVIVASRGRRPTGSPPSRPAPRPGGPDRTTISLPNPTPDRGPGAALDPVPPPGRRRTTSAPQG